MFRHYDPQDRYVGGVLKVYDHWVLEVSWRQHTLASFVIFFRRPGVRLLSELMDGEYLRLKEVMRDMERALRSHPHIAPDHIDYLQVGNAQSHLCMYGIPRYELPRSLLGRMWGDLSYGSPPVWTSKDQNPSDIEALRDLLLPLLA